MSYFGCDIIIIFYLFIILLLFVFGVFFSFSLSLSLFFILVKDGLVIPDIGICSLKSSLIILKYAGLFSLYTELSTVG